MKHVTKTETKTYREVAKAAALCRRHLEQMEDGPRQELQASMLYAGGDRGDAIRQLASLASTLDHFKSGCAANFGPPHRAAEPRPATAAPPADDQ